MSHLAVQTRGILWAGGDLDMTGCLECPLTRPVLAQGWSQTATDGAWYSTTILLSGRDRTLSLSVLRWCGSEPETRWIGEWCPRPPCSSLLARALVMQMLSIANSCRVKKSAIPDLVCTYQRLFTCVHGVRGLSVDYLSSKR